MAESVILKKEKGRLIYNAPISKAQWLEFLSDKDFAGDIRLRALLAFYYLPNHQGTYQQCHEKYGLNLFELESAIRSLSEEIAAKTDLPDIVDADGHKLKWPVVMSSCKPVKGNEGIFKWALSPELVEAIRDMILKDAVKEYSKDFSTKWNREEYKWTALKTFQDNWDIDAADFADMLDKSLSHTGNLLVSQNSFPRLMITSYANQEPETVRVMFRALFDESIDLEQRISDFMSGSNELLEKYSPGKAHYQNTNSISTYLWLRFPEKYYIYKWSEYNKVAEKIGFDNHPKANGQPSEAIKGYAMYNRLQQAVAADESLISTYNKILDEHPDKYYKPSGLATLAFDLGFWISRYYDPMPDKKQEIKVADEIDIVSEPHVDQENIHYWWLVASPKYWSFSDLKIGNSVEYTVKNDNGNKRRIAVNFEQAKKGDVVIGYEANPVKKIVALAKVARASDGETIAFEKTEELESPISWFDFKDLPELSGMEFMKNKNGSFFKLTKAEYDFLLDLIRQENPEPENNPIQQTYRCEPYSVEQFLREVFMTPEAYDSLTTLLKLKKNVILQGAPGVGKTFSAKRVAYSMMGIKDDSRIEMVQFHQNYSYEDFIMGYKPTESGGFELRNGLFYNFCKKAEANPDEDYFFIIDEINRGNLSKIFGELLMLIEKNYRGTQIKLAYRNELFSVPENLYIIGMMNTADRSLAMIDYALRRRFSFYPIKPGFDTEGFLKEIERHPDPRVAKVIDAVKELNNRISDDDSLGEGFCIGHSYFCSQPEDDSWIESVVNHDLCPMLDEYWFDSREKCRTEKNKLRNLLK